jgi:hypothetical protein
MAANLPSFTAADDSRPLVTAVLAAAHQDRNNAGPAPDAVLRGWSRLIDDGRRAVN